MKDLCWIPQARAYSLGLYVDEKELNITIERETEQFLYELNEREKTEGSYQSMKGCQRLHVRSLAHVKNAYSSSMCFLCYCNFAFHCSCSCYLIHS